MSRICRKCSKELPKNRKGADQICSNCLSESKRNACAESNYRGEVLTRDIL